MQKDWKYWILFLPVFCNEGENILFLVIISPTAPPFFPILARTDSSQCGPSSQVSAGHFRSGVQTCRRLCSDQLNELTSPTEPVPLKVQMKLLTIQGLRLYSFIRICKPESVTSSFQSWPFPSYFPASLTLHEIRFPCRFCSPWLRGGL